MAPRRTQKLPYRSVGRNGVGLGNNGFEEKAALSIRLQPRARLGGMQLGPLQVIKTFFIGLPDIQLRMGNRLPVASYNPT